ncbi:hypothetical protein ABPG75_006476 [Micractinium tetrahymenae]
MPASPLDLDDLLLAVLAQLPEQEVRPLPGEVLSSSGAWGAALDGVLWIAYMLCDSMLEDLWSCSELKELTWEYSEGSSLAVAALLRHLTGLTRVHLAPTDLPGSAPVAAALAGLPLLRTAEL